MSSGDKTGQVWRINDDPIVMRLWTRRYGMDYSTNEQVMAK
jgi:hypothetical protein